MGYLIVIIIVLGMFLIYRFSDRIEKNMPWLWKNVAQPIFKYFFVISVRKVTIAYFTTMAGICVAFPAIQFVIDKDHNIEAAITFNGSSFDWAAVIIAALLTIGYALYIFFEAHHNKQNEMDWTKYDNVMVQQYGDKSIYVEKNEGQIFVGNAYIEESFSAFSKGSYELKEYTPTIHPAIHRDEVDQIKDWIEKKASDDRSSRLALLYGKAGIGKSIVMHDLLEELQSNQDYLVLGLKSDQVEFVDTEVLRQSIHLAKPIETVVEEIARKYKRVILLIDQIDALSLSLSSNRTPLRSLLKLIGQIQHISNVRVVISCRPYDLEYDPLLDNLRIKNKWELKEFTDDQVKSILSENGCVENMSDNLLRFLGNPLHLYLFLKVKPEEQLTDPLSTDLLYHQLWRKYVLDDSIRKVNKEQLLALFDKLVTTMYKRQELSVHIREFETGFGAELQYLFTSELLLKTKSNQIQFFHQTLFDYVYARRFTEQGRDLLKELRGQHQGLFSRAAVKSILTFLRVQNHIEYIHVIDQLLYAKDNDGKEQYRYHLKSLALSNMAYFETPLEQEKNLISRKIFNDKVYMDVLFESVYMPNWFDAIWEIIECKGGWKALSQGYKEKAMLMCERTLWRHANVVLDKLDTSLDFEDEEDCKYLSHIFQHYNLDCGSDKLITFYNKLVKSRLPLEHVHLLQNIMKGNPDFVCQELIKNIRLQLQEKDTKYIHRIGINHEEEHLYEELLKHHRDKGIQLLVDILTMVYDNTKFELEGSEIYNSTEFFSFRRTIAEHFASNFIEDAVNILIDNLLKDVDGEKVSQYLSEFSQSNHEGFVFIALYVYTENPVKFKDDIFDIIVKRSVLANAPSWVEYQAVEALKVAYPLWDDEKRKTVISHILAIDDKGEHILFKDAVQMRLQWGHPLLDIDLHKGKAFYSIPKEELRRLSWTAYQEKQRIERKFKEARLKNGRPSSMSTHMGWTSLREDQGMKMSPKTWHKSMLAYTNDPMDWNKPSLTGQCHLFRAVVAKEPDKFISLIDTVLDDNSVLLDYPQAGMQGLLDAGRMNDALHVLERILDVIGNDVNSTIRGFSLHSLLFILNEIPKLDHVPELVFKLLCNALLNAKEPEEDRHKDDKDVQTVGINQSRGNAGYMLVKCAREDQYKDGIFSTIEQIASTASVYTRAAVLLNMAVLNFLDKNRNVELFKKLMHDFNPRLMSMPVHNYNPLVYFVNYAVDDLMEFFSHAVEYPECYCEQVVILWLAWSHNNRDERIKTFLDKMCETSEDARISLMKFLCTLDGKMNEDAICYILHFMESKFDTPKMGDVCDNLFHHADKWADDYQQRVAEVFVDSPLSRHKVTVFIEFLAGYAIKEPVQTLKWLEQIIANDIPDDYFIVNHVVDVLIQSYNGIKSFNDSSYQDTLEHAMDLMDTIMQNPSNKYLITNFINKLDNE